MKVLKNFIDKLKNYFKNKKEIYNQIIQLLKVNKKPFIISGGNTIKNIFKNLDEKINNVILLSDERLIKKNSKLRNDYFFKNLIKKKLILKKRFISYEKCQIDLDSLKKLNKKNQQDKI